MRNDFTLDPNLIYLNSGTHSICPKVVIRAVQNHQTTYELNPTANLFAAWGRLWKVQQALGAYFYASPYDLFLRPNVTSVMNDLLLGLSIERGGELLIGDLEYGAIANLCRLKCEREGLELRLLEFTADPRGFASWDEAGASKHVLSQISSKTRVLVLSHVMTGTGLKLPIEQIARETRAKKILFVVDGAHAPGAMPIDFRHFEDVDFYAGGFHKWMLGPKGTAFGWVPQRNHDRLFAICGGWTSYGKNPVFEGFAEGNSFQLKMLNSGCCDFAPYFALEQMLEYRRQVSDAAIEQRLKELRDILEKQMVRKLGWSVLTPPDPKLRGPLLSFQLPHHLETKGFALIGELLNRHHLQIAAPLVKDRIVLRLSPHVYNTEEECDRAVEILSRY